MTKLLQNKPIIKFLGIALSILLIVALVPQINIAYGSKDDVLVDTGTEESAEGTSDSEGTEGTEDAEGEEEGGLSDENALDGEILGEEEPPTGEEAGIMATALPEENPETVAETPVETTSKELAGNASQPIDGDVTNTSSPLTFSGDGNYTLTVNGTLRSDIKVTDGAKLTIVGAGTIQGWATVLSWLYLALIARSPSVQKTMWGQPLQEVKDRKVLIILTTALAPWAAVFSLTTELASSCTAVLSPRMKRVLVVVCSCGMVVISR